MSNNKTERILNLFFVLLNANRPLNRKDIRGRVFGYDTSTSEAAFERMFERDKDELRQVGINIDTVIIDPLFEDEFGYKIDSDIFMTKEVSWSNEEKVILSMASRIWKETEFNTSAKMAGIKIGTKTEIGSNLETDNEFLQSYRLIIGAINLKKEIEFEYISLDDNLPNKRNIIPVSIKSRNGDWYLNGIDLKDRVLKTFNLMRITSLIQVRAISEIEVDLIKKQKKLNDEVSYVTVEFRSHAKHFAEILKGEYLEKELVRIPFFEKYTFAKYLLSFSASIVDIKDDEIKEIYLAELTGFKRLFA
jgi:predicted DNA-binding transcriptional regulator YafY